MPRTKSSASWLSRHLSDPFVKQAQKDGYRSRSAYKLVELNEKDKLIRPGMRIMDLGSAPGGWSQVAGRLVGAKGRLLATDIQEVQSDPKLKLSTAPELGYAGITINVGKDKSKGPLSQSEKIRRALDLSIDREALNQVVFNGEFTPGNQWISPEHPYYQKAFPVPPRDLAKAKALLKEANVPLPVSVEIGRAHV